MLGEHIGNEHGHATGRRVIPGADDFRYMKMEISFEAETEMLGVTGQNIGTFTVFERRPGQMYAEGHGIVMTADGEGVIWNGHGVGHGTPDGSMIIAASIACQTTSEKLADLNDTLIVLEHHSHGDGHMHSDFWTWSAAGH